MSISQSKHLQTIVDVAVQLFRKYGYENVSVNEICKKADISRSSFYATFSSKKDIIEHVITQARRDEPALLSRFVDAKNDFERMWILCDRYLQVVLTLGPELTGTLLRLELMGEIDMIGMAREGNDMFIRLYRNAQQAGVILSREPAERMAPIGPDAVYLITYDWARQKGRFSLRAKARQTSEMIYNVAPEYRWTEEQLEQA